VVALVTLTAGALVGGTEWCEEQAEVARAAAAANRAVPAFTSGS
jgi:hypothetical protein